VSRNPYDHADDAEYRLEQQQDRRQRHEHQQERGSQRGQGRGSQNRRSPVDERSQYGGVARHDQREPYAGGERTFGRATDQRGGQRGDTGQDAGTESGGDLAAQSRQSPTDEGGYELYGCGHAHDVDAERSPVGESIDERRR